MQTVEAATAKIQAMKGYTWQMFQFPGGNNDEGPGSGEPGDPTKPRPATFFRTECAANSTSATTPIMMRFSSTVGTPGATLPSFEQDLAAFLLVSAPQCVLVLCNHCSLANFARALKDEANDSGCMLAADPLRFCMARVQLGRLRPGIYAAIAARRRLWRAS